MDPRAWQDAARPAGNRPRRRPTARRDRHVVQHHHVAAQHRADRRARPLLPHLRPRFERRPRACAAGSSRSSRWPTSWC
nr:hypothetical protein [Angustibacter aerolatus]